MKEFAESVISMGDLNGDTCDDIAVIEELSDGNYSDVYVFYGASVENCGSSSSVADWDINSPDILIKNDADIDGDDVDNYTNFKSTNIQNVGDVDGDGVNDIAIVSATSVSYPETLGEVATEDLEGYGLVVVHNNLGDSSISVRNTYLDSYITLFNPDPTQPVYSFGQSFTSGDLDGDGNTDFIVGGKSIDTNTEDSISEEGGAFVYYGPLMGSYDSAHAFISGEVAATNDKDYARLGSAVGHYSDGADTSQIILVSPDIADGTGAGKDSSDAGTIYVLDSSSIDTSQ